MGAIEVVGGDFSPETNGEAITQRYRVEVVPADQTSLAFALNAIAAEGWRLFQTLQIVARASHIDTGQKMQAVLCIFEKDNSSYTATTRVNP